MPTFPLSAKKGVLLLQLGTPTTLSLSAVRQYLREFLMDPRVIDLAYPLRFALVQGLFLPLRSRKTLAAYQKIWTAEGSPLRLHSLALQKALQETLPDHYHVCLGMRYGQPSLAQALEDLMALPCASLDVIPLYPQYASATTGSGLSALFRLLSKKTALPNIRVHPPFYNHPGFIQAFAQVIQDHLNRHPADFLLFSYHGLPERHLQKVGCYFQTHCKTQDKCPPHAFCYRRQCLLTTQGLLAVLKQDPSLSATTFQSRVGRLPWIGPDTEGYLKIIYNQGIRRLAVACPSFVSDCLETLEEVGCRLQSHWLNLGGQTLSLVPSLNKHPIWVNTLATWIQGKSGQV